MKTTTKLKKKLNKLAQYLDKNRVKFKLLTHKIVYTAHDSAQTLKKKVNEIAKVVLVKADKSLALVIVPAGKYVDFKAIQKALKVKKIAIATEKDIAKYLKVKVGLLHPFGNLYKIPTLIDRGFAKAKKFVAAAGSYTESVEIALKDFEKLAQPIKGIFSKAKK
jgi:prolyl-tRNA editing enzyme YbaK/EbsC (Cys-tRNA(Pro) deacylase)